MRSRPAPAALAVSVAVLALLTAAGASATSVRPAARGSSPAVTTSAAGASAAGHRRRALREAHHLLRVAELPGARHRLARPPRGLRGGPASGTPAVRSLVDVTRSYRVGLSFARAARWLRRHVPAGLTPAGSGESTVDGRVVERSISYGAPDSTAWVQAQLAIGVVRGRAGTTLWRVDGVVPWLDPRPVRDRTPGPRARITTRTGCPASVRHLHDVRNRGARLAHRMLPPGRPTGVLLCRYAGLNGAAFRLRAHRIFGPRVSAGLSRRLRRMRLSHLDGAVTSCPLDDGTVEIASFAYRGRPDVAIWIHPRGCATDDNGRIVGTDVIGRAVTRLLHR